MSGARACAQLPRERERRPPVRRGALLLAGAMTLALLGIVAPAVTEASGANGIETAERVTEYFDRLQAFGFSGVAAVASGDSLLRAQGYGLANREQGIPNRPDTVFTIGSITKPFTALLVLQLVQSGALSLDDPIGRHFDAVPADKASITIENLLTHTSGLKRNSPPTADGETDFAATRKSVLRDALESDLVVPVGSRFSYSNVAYSLLAMIVENASGVPYEQLLFERVLQPAGMLRTGYRIPTYRDDELAWGYHDADKIRPVIRLPGLEDGPSWVLRGNGGLHSTAGDMFRFYVALEDHSLLSPATQGDMISVRVAQPDGVGYGLGWELRQGRDGRRIVSHSGGNPYFGAHFQWHVDHDLMIYVATNDPGPLHFGRLAEQLSLLVLGDMSVLPPRLAKVDDAALARWNGEYELTTGGRVSVAAEGNALVFTAEHGNDAVQLVRGGSSGHADPALEAISRRSQEVVEQEYAGNLQLKYEAMHGATPLADLERYRQYDREFWDAEFGVLQTVEIASVAGQDEVTEVIIRMRFERGEAGQVHTWRGDRLANISVIPNWNTYHFSRHLYPIGPDRFESYRQSTRLRTRIDAVIEDTGAVLRARPGSLLARRISG